MQSVSIGRLDRKRFLIARKSFLFPSHLFLQDAEIEPCVREVGTPGDRLPVGDFRLARPSELVENIAEVERNDRIVLVEAARKIVPSPGRVQVSFLLARLRPGERLVGVHIWAVKREQELPIDLSQRSLEHLQELPPRRFGEPHGAQAHPSALKSESGDNDLGKLGAGRDETANGTSREKVRVGKSAVDGIHDVIERKGPQLHAVQPRVPRDLILGVLRFARARQGQYSQLRSKEALGDETGVSLPLKPQAKLAAVRNRGAHRAVRQHNRVGGGWSAGEP